MRAKVIEAFPGVPDGESRSREIEVGEVITGDLARVAISQKWAEEVSADETADDADRGEKPLSKMKVDELKAYAESRKIDLGDATRRDDILAAIKDAEAAERDRILAEGTVEDLQALAQRENVDLSGVNDRDAIVAALSVAKS